MKRKGTQQRATRSAAEEVRARRARAAVRRVQAINLRIAGKTYAEIGTELGISKRSAHKLVTKELAKRAEEARESSEQLRQIDLARTEALIKSVWDRATDPGLATVEVPADNELGFKPYDGQDKAIDRVTKLLERRAKLMGLDTPTTQKLEHTGAGGLPLALPAQLAMLAPHLPAGLSPAPTVAELEHFAEVAPEACRLEGCRIHPRSAPALPPAR